MPKLAKFRRRHAAKNGEPKRNPPLGTDIVEYILPGFGAFAATRFLTRVAAVQIAKRWPKYAKHAGAMASAGAFAAAWFGAHRVKYLEKYHHPIVVGSGLAALQSIIQLYLPSIGWMVSDCSPELAKPAPKAIAGSMAPLLAGPQPTAISDSPPIPDGFTQVDANAWYSYNDSYDAGSYKNKVQAAPPIPMVSEPDEQQIDDLLDNSDMGLS